LSVEDRGAYTLERFEFNNGVDMVVPGILVIPKQRRRSENSIAIGERGLLVKDCGWGFKLKAGAGSVVK
jgi:hypothetical protein